MHRFAEQFALYCEHHFNLNNDISYHYNSLPICIIDCIYSLRAKYYATTSPIVQRYAVQYMNGDIYNPSDTISQFLAHIDELGGPLEFANQVLCNHQQLGGKNHIPKEVVCYQLAQYLKYLHIETLEDFQNFESQELLEVVIRSVKGLGDAGVNYLFMLAGDSERCKPDVHIHRCIKDACGSNISNEECQILFTDAVQLLHHKYPSLTVRNLDNIIWREYQSK